MSGSPDLDTVRKWSQEIDKMINSSIDENRVRAILDGLLKGSLSYAVLKDSDIGRRINTLRKAHLDSYPELYKSARVLIKSFKSVFDEHKVAVAKTKQSHTDRVPPNTNTPASKLTTGNKPNHRPADREREKEKGSTHAKSNDGHHHNNTNNAKTSSKTIKQPSSTPKLTLKISNVPSKHESRENKQGESDTKARHAQAQAVSRQSKSPTPHATASQADGKQQGSLDQQRRNGAKDVQNVQRKRQPDAKAPAELDLFTRKKAPSIHLKPAQQDGHPGGHKSPSRNQQQQQHSRSPQPHAPGHAHARSPQPHTNHPSTSPHPTAKSPQPHHASSRSPNVQRQASRSPHPASRSPNLQPNNNHHNSRSPHPQSASRSPHPSSRSPQKTLRSPQKQPPPRSPQHDTRGDKGNRPHIQRPMGTHPHKRGGDEASVHEQPAQKKQQIGKAKADTLFNHANNRMRRENAEHEAKRRQAQKEKIDAARKEDRFYNSYQHTESEKLEQERLKQLKLNPPPEAEAKPDVKPANEVSAENKEEKPDVDPQEPEKPTPEDLLPKIRVPKRHPANARLAKTNNLVSTAHTPYSVNRQWKGVDGDVSADGTWRRYTQTQAISIAPGHRMVVAPYSTPFPTDR